MSLLVTCKTAAVRYFAGHINNCDEVANIILQFEINLKFACCVYLVLTRLQLQIEDASLPNAISYCEVTECTSGVDAKSTVAIIVSILTYARLRVLSAFTHAHHVHMTLFEHDLRQLDLLLFTAHFVSVRVEFTVHAGCSILRSACILILHLQVNRISLLRSLAACTLCMHNSSHCDSPVTACMIGAQS